MTVELAQPSGIDIYKDYVGEPSRFRRVQGLLDLTTQGVESTAIASRLLLNEVFRPTTTAREAEQLFTVVGELNQEVIAKSSNRPVSNQAVIGALAVRAFLPSYRHCKLEKTLPPQELQQAAYSELLSEARRQYLYLKSDANKQTFNGAMAEVVTVLLLNRFGLRHLADEPQTWLAVPALETQNRGHLFKSGPRSGWDVSVLTEGFSSLNEPCYKIQVKSGKHVDKGRPYHHDIDHVAVAHDLATPTDAIDVEAGHYFVTNKTIVSELAHEQFQTDANVSTRLDQRTEQLLDKLTA